MPKKFISILVLLTFFPSVALGLPAGGRMVGGTANISSPKSHNLRINQLTEKAIINWQGFSINVNELVRFIQPSSKSIVLNRVTGVDPSSILGQLVANGRVFIINPNGILFGPNSRVDVSGLLATTLNMRDADFMAGKFNFFQDPGKSPSYVISQGQIRVSDNGFVFLAAPGVSNEGLIIANLGKVVMASGDKLTVDFLGDGLITFAIEGKVLNAVSGPDGAPLSSAVANTGTIKADGGQVVLSAKASSEIFSSVVNNSGVIEARSLVNHGGIIRLEGSDPVPNSGEIGWQTNLGKVQNADGRVLNTGTLDVSALEAGAAPGEVTLSGQMVGVSGSILARGADGGRGGRVLVTSSDKTILTQESVVDTSGVGNSNAGNTVIWSDKDTVFRGTILATGGETGGNGGKIEVSGHENLAFTGQVNALAPNGSIGSLLLDPLNITVANGGAATLPQVDQFSDTPATNQTVAPATINAAAANVTLQANNDITVTNAIAMTNNGVGIAMQAGRDINVNAGVSTTNGNISLTANDSTAIGANRANATTGDIAFGAGADLSAGTGNITLTIDPSTTNPFNPGSITNIRNLTTTGGNISINSPNNVTLSGAVNAGSGTVTINANTDGAGAQGFTMNAGSSITTANATVNAVQINVNAAGGGTGTAALRDITTGSGGTLSIATNTGGNTTGRDITQTAGTMLDVGSGTINLTTPAITGANIGSAGANILTTAGTITASTGTNGVFITENDGANITATATGGGAISVKSTIGALNIAGATSTGSGAITLTADTVDINNSLTSTGALTLTPVTASGDLTVTSSSPANLSDGFSNITIGSASGTGAVTVNALTVSDPLTIRSPTTTGTVTVNGPITALGNASVTLTGGTGTTPIALNSGITTAGNVITLNDNVGLGANVTLDSTNSGSSPTGATISVAGTIDGAQTLTLNGGTAGNVTLSGAIGNTQPLQSLTVTSANVLTMPAATTTGDIQLSAQNAVTLNGGMDAGSGTVTINANTDGAGAQGFTMNAGSSITTTGGLNINVNAAGGGTGTAALRDIATSGTLTVQTNTGGNTTGGAISQTAGTTITAGSANLSTGNGAITLNNATNDFGTVAVSRATNVTLQDANSLNLGASTISGTLNVTTAGAITNSGNLNVTGTTTLAAGAGNDITLDSAGNN
ncbi:MAG TPA: filamentous hemagglutinin N-terminal domain-containing protein, partial [Candidatus Binatia bacterium]